MKIGHRRSSQKEAEKGTYMTLQKIMIEEGGENGYKDPECVKGCLLLATKCIAMGGKWIDINPFTERLEYPASVHH